MRPVIVIPRQGPPSPTKNSQTQVLSPMPAILPATPEDIRPAFSRMDVALHRIQQFEEMPNVECKAVGILSSSSAGEASLFANSFIRNFVTEQTQDVQAIIIQRAFRSFLTRKHYKAYIGLRIRAHRTLEKLFFIAWRLAVVDKPQEVKPVFLKFRNFLPQVPFVAQGREVAHYQYFYLSGQLFVPKGYNANDVFRFMHIMFRITKRRILKLWALTAHNMIKHRYSLNFIRMTAKKQIAFQPVYQLFTMWRRYAQWQKVNKVTVRTPQTFITIETKEQIVKWTVLEKKLNTTNRLLDRARDKFLGRLKVKVIRALFNQSIEKSTQDQVLQGADQFAKQTLLRLGHHAWLKYIEIHQKQHQTLREYVRSWYEITYQEAVKKTQIHFFKIREKRFLIHKILNKWSFLSNIYKVQQMKASLTMQKNSSLALGFLYALKQQFEFYENIVCWRFWLKYTRRRRQWKKFIAWSDQQNENNEKNNMIIFELKTIASMHKIGSQDSHHQILPRGIGFSPELTLRAHKVIQQSLFEETHTHTFITQNEKPNSLSYILLLRSFILLLNKRHGLSIFPQQVRAVEFFDHFRTNNELREQIQLNALIFKKNIKIKQLRDNGIILAIEAHEQFVASAKIFPGFTLCDQPQFDLVYDQNKYGIQHDLSKIEIYPEYKESVKQLVRQLEMAPPRLISTFKQEMKDAFAKLDQRIRPPSKAHEKANTKNQIESTFTGFSESMKSFNKNVTQVIRNPNISIYVKRNPFDKLIHSNEQTDEKKFFGFAKMKSILSEVPPSYICFAVAKCINSLTGMAIKSTPSTQYPDLDLSGRRKLMRNIKLFENETSLINCVSALNGLFCSMKETKLSKYCGDSIFEEYIEQSNIIVLQNRFRVWLSIKRTHPHFEIPQAKNNKAAFKVPRPTSISSFSSIITDKKEELSPDEAYISCFILPLVFSNDSLGVFLEDTMDVNEPKA